MFYFRKKLDRSKDDQDFHDSVVAVLRDPIKETDAVDGFLITLGEGLRKLPYKERSRMQIKFLSMINEKQMRWKRSDGMPRYYTVMIEEIFPCMFKENTFKY